MRISPAFWLRSPAFRWDPPLLAEIPRFWLRSPAFWLRSPAFWLRGLWCFSLKKIPPYRKRKKYASDSCFCSGITPWSPRLSGILKMPSGTPPCPGAGAEHLAPASASTLGYGRVPYIFKITSWLRGSEDWSPQKKRE